MRTRRPVLAAAIAALLSIGIVGAAGAASAAPTASAAAEVTHSKRIPTPPWTFHSYYATQAAANAAAAEIRSRGAEYQTLVRYESDVQLWAVYYRIIV
jgi:hypothetical protein